MADIASGLSGRIYSGWTVAAELYNWHATRDESVLSGGAGAGAASLNTGGESVRVPASSVWTLTAQATICNAYWAAHGSDWMLELDVGIRKWRARNVAPRFSDDAAGLVGITVIGHGGMEIVDG